MGSSGQALADARREAYARYLVVQHELGDLLKAVLGYALGRAYWGAATRPREVYGGDFLHVVRERDQLLCGCSAEPHSRQAAAVLNVRHGSAGDAPQLLALFDDAVAWMVARGQTGQWGSEPFSAKPSRVARAQQWAAGGGLWLAVDDSAGDEPVGAIVLGDALDYVPPADCHEVYVQVLLTASAWRSRGVGARLIEHAVTVGRGQGAVQLRVDCWDGVPALPSQYERLGFTRVGSFQVGNWPGTILTRAL